MKHGDGEGYLNQLIIVLAIKSEADPRTYYQYQGFTVKGL
jgi:hypothetical protein